MIDMGFLGVIRSWALRDTMPIREIARRTGLSRNTVKKHLREGAVEPKFKTPPRPTKRDPYADRLSAWLLAQTRKPRKERRTVKMRVDLVKLGYGGSYGQVEKNVQDARNRLWQVMPVCKDLVVRGFGRPKIWSLKVPPLLKPQPRCCHNRSRPRLLDALGYLPFSSSGGALLSEK
jgi:transposase